MTDETYEEVPDEREINFLEETGVCITNEDWLHRVPTDISQGIVAADFGREPSRLVESASKYPGFL